MRQLPQYDSVARLLEAAPLEVDGAGECLFIERDAAALPPAAREGVAKFSRELAEYHSPLRQVLCASLNPESQPSLHSRIVFLDIETAGLSRQKQPLFLIGVMVWSEGRFVIRQYLACHPEQEAAVVAAFCRSVEDSPVLITYNGRRFDVPYIEQRAFRHGTPLHPPPVEHLDLLYSVRRAWRRRLPDCKLETVERHICGRIRTGDIPGSLIPWAWQRFVRTGDVRDMRRILEHNALDLATLADVAVRLHTEDGPIDVSGGRSAER